MRSVCSGMRGCPRSVCALQALESTTIAMDYENQKVLARYHCHRMRPGMNNQCLSIAALSGTGSDCLLPLSRVSFYYIPLGDPNSAEFQGHSAAMETVRVYVRAVRGCMPHLCCFGSHYTGGRQEGDAGAESSWAEACGHCARQPFGNDERGVVVCRG